MAVAGVADGMGQAVLRKEDPPLVQGIGTYTDDVKVEGAAHIAFVRAGWAHGKINSIDTSAAKEAPGVVAVYTAADLDLAPMAAGDLDDEYKRPILAGDRVRFMGEAVAVVVAETRGQAVDAAELVDVDLEPLPVVVDFEAAAADDAPKIFDAGNVCQHVEQGSEGDALEDAEVVVEARLVNQRIAAAPMEPSSAVAVPDPDTGGVKITAPVQAQFGTRAAIAGSLGIDESKVRVVSHSVGGGFGARIACYPEQILTAALALKLDRPVRYVEGRSETMVAMQHGRGQVQYVKLGAKRDGTLTGLKLHVYAECGAYPVDGLEMPMLTGLVLAGAYKLPKLNYSYDCVATNTTPMGAYRGAGRPEATALIERAMDMLAVELGMDPTEVRRKNFIPPEEFPAKTVCGTTYDTGEYAMALDRVMGNAGYEELRAEQKRRRDAGEAKQLGIGLCTYIEWTGFGNELGTCSVEDDGSVTISVGTTSQGQGHETAWAQLVVETLGVGLHDVNLVHSDTGRVRSGMGTMGSRSLQVGGSAVLNATRDVLEKGKKLAAHVLEADPGDVEVVPGEGLGVAGVPGSVLSWADLAAAAADPSRRPADFGEEGLSGENDFATPDATYPFGAHIAVVEVDTETGGVTLQRHITVDDSGTMLNPMMAAGQIHGGIAQGVAQALFEEIAYDEDGNNVTGSFAAYAMPGATELPSFETERTQTPTFRNPVGAKGIGESGAIGSTPAVWNACVDALSHLGVKNLDMPVTPQRVWAAVNGG
jgi:aerobic carbon-monoxide dehydrogenase large subunit